jgi:BirA family biotin operon repressor/biotin-[acetyl-CoA-carboxylase] ligase
MTRTAISPRFAIKTFVSTRRHSVSVILEERVRAGLASTTRFTDIRLLDETTSTNTVAAGLGTEGVVVVADFQTAGRGRLDRSWEARPGDALLASVVLRPGLPPERRHLTTAAVALAARQACRRVAGVEPDVKWPNDLLLGAAKLAGVLAESSGEAVVVGMGLNVHGGPPGAAVLDQAAGTRVGRAELLEQWLLQLDRRLVDWDAVGEEYRSTCATVGRRVAVELAEGRVVTGTAEAVDRSGRLVVRADDGTVTAYAVGDVTHLR